MSVDLEKGYSLCSQSLVIVLANNDNLPNLSHIIVDEMSMKCPGSMYFEITQELVDSLAARNVTTVKLSYLR